MKVILINEENIKELYYAIYKQAFVDFKTHKNVPDKEQLYDWMLNEGRVQFAPFLDKEELREKLNEYL